MSWLKAAIAARVDDIALVNWIKAMHPKACWDGQGRTNDDLLNLFMTPQ